MVYVFCMFFCVSLFSFAEKKGKINRNVYNLLALFVILTLALMLGLRNNVGGDWKTYYKIFKTGDSHILSRGDYLFYWFTVFLSNYKIDPHYGFFICALVQMVFLMLFIKEIEIKYISFYFILYFCFSRVFVSSTNGIRIYTAIYMCSYAIILLLKKKCLPACGVFLTAYFIHHSTIIILAILPLLLLFVYKSNKYVLFLILVMGVFLSRMDTNKMIKMIVKLTVYSGYLNDSQNVFYNRRIDFINIISKYIYIPLFIIALYKYKSYNLDAFHRKLFNLGIISFSIRLIGLSSYEIAHLASYFYIFDIYPLYCLLMYHKHWNRNYRFLVFLIIFGWVVLPELFKYYYFSGAGGMTGYDFQFDDLVIWNF